MAKFMEWVNSNLKHNFLLLTKEQYDDIKKFWKQMINLDLTKIWGKSCKKSIWSHEVSSSKYRKNLICYCQKWNGKFSE